MKKIFLSLAFILICAFPAQAGEARLEASPLKRFLVIERRGLLNLLGLPVEIPTSVAREARLHKRLWPVTSFARVPTNLFIRLTSGINDILFFPWVTPFTDEITPLTTHLGLPEYPWQKEE